MDTTGWASATVAYLAKKLSDEVWVLISVWSKVQRFARHLADTRVVGYWRGYLSGARCRLAYGPADATVTHCLLLQ